jgi:hypothetical protein
VVLSTLEQLIDLYCDSDPRLGPTSEKGKHWAALTAIRLAGDLRYHLTGWAEDHIAGAIFRHAHTQDKSRFDWNSHANEHQYLASEEGLALTAEQFREYIATMLERSARSRMDWRQQLSDSLAALNEGEVQFLTSPSKTSKHGRPFTLRQLRWFAVLHVHVLVGSGMKKYAAENRIADELAVSVETLRAWEKQFLKKNSELKQTLLLARKLVGLEKKVEFGSDQESADYIGEWSRAYAIRLKLREHPTHVLARELKESKARP